MYNWFCDYLTNWKQYVTITNTLSYLDDITCRVPQGSVLGPLLFLMYVKMILKTAPDACIKLFADDTSVFLHGKSIEDMISKANNTLSIVMSQCLVFLLVY